MATDTTSATALEGRVAVVTGASSGMGAATAELLAARGAKVALIARRKDRLDEVAERIRSAGGTAMAITADMTDPDAVRAAATQVADELGNASLVFNNAGIMLPAPITEHRTDQWRQQIDINITAVMSTIDGFVDQLVASAAAGTPTNLINTASIAAQQVFPNFAVYGASKAFVSHLTRHLHAELGPKHVRVSTIEPGIVETELWGYVTDSGAQEFYDGARSGMELLQNTDIAEIVAFTAALPSRVTIQQMAILPTNQA